MPSGIHVILAGFSSMAQLDTDPHTQAYRDALGDEGRSKMQKLVGDAIMSVGRMLFQFSPRMSVPPAWAKATQ